MVGDRTSTSDDDRGDTMKELDKRMIYYDEKHKKQIRRDVYVFGICLVMIGVGLGMIVGAWMITKGWIR